MTHHETVNIGQPDSAADRASGEIGWNIALPVLLAGAVALCGIHWETVYAMYDRWVNIHSYNHAFLILPVCLYLAWERRLKASQLKPRASLFGLVLVLGFAAMWLVADSADVMAGRQAALVGMLQALALATLGWRVCKLLMFPLLYAWLAVPFDLGLLPYLQAMATVATSWGIGLLDIPLFVEGFIIELPSGRYWIAPGCAGLNYLLSGFALSLLYGEQMYDGWRKRVACVAIMIVISIIANWIRIFALIGAGHYLGKIYDINDHYMEGWLFFAAVLFVMMWIGLRFRDPLPEPGDEADKPQSAPAPKPAALATYLAVAILSVAGAASFPAYAAYQQANLPAVKPVHIAFPASLGGWQLKDGRSSNWEPKFQGADAQAIARYVHKDRQVDLFVAYYERQGSGREVVAYNNRVFDNETWHRQRGGAARTRFAGTETVLTELVVRSGNQRRLVWQIYWADSQYSRSPTRMKLLQAKVNLLFGDRRAGFIAVSSPNEDPAALADFLREMPSIVDFVAPGASGG